MGTLTPIIHSRLHRELDRFYPALVTIQQPTGAQRPDGEPVDAWQDVAGLVGLNGNLAARRVAELRGVEFTSERATHALNLAGNYPQIQPEWRAVVDGVTFNVAGRPQNDSLGKSTRLELEETSH
jgi:head-tail adaptor